MKCKDCGEKFESRDDKDYHPEYVCELRQKLTAERKKVGVLREAIEGLIESSVKEANEKGLGGFHGARITDAQIALSETAGGKGE